MDVCEVDLIQRDGMTFLRTIDYVVTAIKENDTDKLVTKMHFVTDNHKERGVVSKQEYEVFVK
jgi:hypothetical protein